MLTDPQIWASYATDWTGRYSGAPRLVVRPANTTQVAAVLRSCVAAGVAICVQGGHTGLAGGGTPLDGQVVLSTQRLAQLAPVDTESMQVQAGAGVPLAQLQAHVHAAGLEVPVDLASRGTATLGGMAATNAGGVRVLRHGPMRSCVTGVEAVLADGRVLRHLGGLPADSAGYDLTGLLVGSEGTLAVITEVRVRLVPRPAERTTALVGLGSLVEAIALTADLRRQLGSLESVEVMFAGGLDLVGRHRGLPAPPVPDAPVHLLLECAGRAGETAELAAVLAALAEGRSGQVPAAGSTAGVLGGTVATDAAGRHALWAYREGHPEAVSALGTPIKLDVGLPQRELAAFVAELPRLVAQIAPGTRTFLWGHLAEGTLHVNLLPDTTTAWADPDTSTLVAAVLGAAGAHGGTVSAEHGVGRAKAPWLHLCRTPVEVAAFRAIKRALDPEGWLNPGVLLPRPELSGPPAAAAREHP